MRRKHCEVTDPAAVDRILTSARIGRMASMGSDGYPYITPVNFVWYEGKIYFHCAKSGEKLDNVERNSKVCFEVDLPLAYLDTGFDPERSACRAHQLYHCVIVRGEARVVPDSPLKVAALNALVRSHEPEADFQQVSEDAHPYQICHVIEVTPRSISAKSDLWQNKSPEKRFELARYLKERNLPSDEETIAAMGIDPAEL